MQTSQLSAANADLDLNVGDAAPNAIENVWQGRQSDQLAPRPCHTRGDFAWFIVSLQRPKDFLRWKLKALARKAGLKLLDYAGTSPRDIYWDNNGILKWQSHVSGEEWFIENCLISLLSDIEDIRVLDIGANVGAYSRTITKALPKATCYALEPNPDAFTLLQKNTATQKNIIPLRLGASNQAGEIKLYAYENETHTEHASLYQDVFRNLHGDSKPIEIRCSLERIDDLIERQIIPSEIHFVKADTEGHELHALQGAQRLIHESGVRVVQFEFNEMNVVSKVFLKDFYEFFGNDWQLFRLNTQSLIPLGPYDSANEIFKYQNIIAINFPKCRGQAERLFDSLSHNHLAKP